MKVGQTVKHLKTGKLAKVKFMNGKNVTHIQDIDSGQIIRVVNDAIVLVKVAKSIWNFIKNLFKKNKTK